MFSKKLPLASTWTNFRWDNEMITPNESSKWVKELESTSVSILRKKHT